MRSHFKTTHSSTLRRLANEAVSYGLIEEKTILSTSLVDSKVSPNRTLNDILYLKGYFLVSRQQNSSSFAKRPYNGTFNYNTYRKLLMNLMIRNNLPFTTIYSPAFKELFTYIKPDLPFISRNIIRLELENIYKISCLAVKDKLQKTKGRFTLTLDQGKSSSNLDFLGVTIHYNDDSFELKTETIGFENLNKKASYTGNVLYESLVDVLNEYGIKDRIVSINRDNAGHINVLVNNFTKDCNVNSTGIVIDGDTRCAGYFFNLATNAFLGSIHFIPGSSKSLARSLEAIEGADPGLGHSF